jgi:hypothetical protein
MYGAEAWQIATREINKMLSTEMNLLRRTARKSRMERIKNEQIKKIMGVKGKPDIIDIMVKKRLQSYGHVKSMPEEENAKINYGMDTRGEKKKRKSKKNVDGRTASSHDSEKFRTRSMEKQRGMAFGLWETATAVTKLDREMFSSNPTGPFCTHVSIKRIKHMFCPKLIT